MSSLYSLIRPLLFKIEAETAHRLAVRVIASGLIPAVTAEDDPILATTVWGKRFSNPIGLAAGFDKNAETLDSIFRLGFGFVEAGSVTPLPQIGNPRPRVFRLPHQQAVINRYGFNNDGIEAFAARAKKWRAKGERHILGINIGANKERANSPDDYVTGLTRLADLADYVVVNISSPNTPGLRGLQNPEALTALLEATKAARNVSATRPPLLVKIAPDLTPEMMHDIADTVMRAGIDGMIVSNTTLARPAELPERWHNEAGGLSGQPLRDTALACLRTMYGLTAGQLPLIGAGGIASGADAYVRIRAGASLVQLYTALIYGGPGLVGRIKRDLAALLRRDGFSNVTAAVGAG